MRIACLGNMNNNMFCLVRYLRRQGLDAHLLLLSHEQQHFLPEADTHDDAYLAYTRRLSWGSEPDFGKTDPAQIRADLAGFDAFVACNYAPAFLHKAGIAVDLFCPHGSDYNEVPFYAAADGSPTPLAVAQRGGIAQARHIMATPTNAVCEGYWHRLEPRGLRIPYPIPLIFLPEYDEEHTRPEYADEAGRALLSELRARGGLVAMQHTRQCWSNPALANDHKGNDVLLRGFARFLAESGAQADLVLLEYGPDVEASRRLAQELGLARAVHWLPKTQRKRLMPLLRMADLCALEFRYSWIAGGALFETLALERPMLARRDDQDHPGRRLFPLLRAATSEEVAQRLADFTQDRAAYADMGAQGRRWLEEEITAPAVQAALAVLRGEGPLPGWTHFGAAPAADRQGA